MMHGLKLQPAVDEIQPGRALHVHGGAQLALRERLAVAQVRRRHRPVRERDLHVQRHCDDVRDEHERDAQGPGGEGAPEEAVAEEGPVAEHECDLGRARPGGGAEVCGAGRQQVQPGEEVEVEAGDGHDGVVGVGLVADGEVGEGVPDVGEVVVGGVEGLEEGGGGGEEGDVLDVGVVFGVVGYEVVDVVAGLPPADAQAAAEVGDEHADQGVGDEVVGYASMAGIVGGEHDLVLMVCQLVRSGFGSCRGSITQNSPRKAADVRYHSARRHTTNSANNAE